MYGPMTTRRQYLWSSRGTAPIQLIRGQNRVISKLTCDDDTFTTMLEHLRQALPAEGVGLLSAIRSGRELVAGRFYEGRNIESSRTRYTMHPADVSTALNDIERRGEVVGAVVHSHPRTPPVPSRFDLIDATLPGIVHVIAGFQPMLSVRAWWLDFDQHGNAVAAREVEFKSGVVHGEAGERDSFPIVRGEFEQRGDDGRGRREFA